MTTVLRNGEGLKVNRVFQELLEPKTKGKNGIGNKKSHLRDSEETQFRVSEDFYMDLPRNSEEGQLHDHGSLNRDLRFCAKLDLFDNFTGILWGELSIKFYQNKGGRLRLWWDGIDWY